MSGDGLVDFGFERSRGCDLCSIGGVRKLESPASDKLLYDVCSIASIQVCTVWRWGLLDLLQTAHQGAQFCVHFFLLLFLSCERDSGRKL